MKTGKRKLWQEQPTSTYFTFLHQTFLWFDFRPYEICLNSPIEMEYYHSGCLTTVAPNL